MQVYNEAARTQLNSESGLVWTERLSDAIGTLEVQKYATVRVRSTGVITVTIGGVLAATMSAGEIMIFNTGKGDTSDDKKSVTVLIAGADTAFLQVGATKQSRNA